MCLFEVVSKKRMGNVPASPEEEHQVLESSNKQEIEEIYVFLAELKMGLEKDVARVDEDVKAGACLLYTSPSPRDQRGSRMPSSA